ncbi:MAG: ABC transporter ATP-binding protein [Methylophilaceae bacterium]|nr:ABC transporter ATP-binding protein [Methylophilaceae bacterium]
MSHQSSDLSLRVQQSTPFALDAEFDCAAGELMALFGPSGSGKSTLLRMVAGLAKLQSGQIHSGKALWAGQHVHLSPQQRRVGYVPQNYGLFPHMDALNNVESSLHHLPKAERTRVAHEWLERMHLNGLANRKPAALSGGQQQRVALARALAVNPTVLLLDEPFSAVDANTREKLYAEIVELRSQLNMPILLVTHDLHEALILADKITLLSHGKTLQSGTPQSVMKAPITPTAASLLGLRNIFESQVVQYDEAEKVSILQFGQHQIEVKQTNQLAEGSKVRWLISDAGIRFRAISRQDITAHSNRIPVTVLSQITLGDQVRLLLKVSGVEATIQVNIPLRLAQELALQVGVTVDVLLRAEDIHIFADHE